MSKLDKRLVTPALLAGPAAFALGLGALTGGHDFVAQHWAALAGGGLGLGLFLRVVVSLLRATGKGVVRFGEDRQALGESGAVMTEFVIVLMPFLLVFFGIMQMAMISIGRILVSYAAFAAARAAIVMVPGDRPGEAPGKLNMNAAASGKIGAVSNAAAYALIPVSPPIDQVAHDFTQQFGDHLESQALGGIHDAATDAFGNMVGNIITGVSGAGLNALMTPILNSFAAANTSGEKNSVARAFDKGGWGVTDSGAEGAIKRALTKFIYARMATIVQLQSEEGGVRYAYKWNDPIKAKVTFLFMCRIPIASWFAGKRFHEQPAGVMDAIANSPLQSMMGLGGVPGYYIGLTASHVLVNQGKP